MTIMCPYCFEDMDSKKMLYYCENCKREIEPSKNKGKDSRYKCPLCEGSVYLRICRQYDGTRIRGCGRPLPTVMDDVDSDTMIAIVGPKAVGKSQFIAVLFNELKTEFAHEFGTSFYSPLDTTMRKNRTYQKHLYSDLEVVPETIPIEVDDSTGEPFVYYLDKKSKFGKKKAVTLLFYDTAGDDLRSSNTIMRSTISKYLAKAKGIIYLVDPLQMKEVNASIKVSNVPIVDDESDVTEVLGRITEAIRNVNGLKKDEMINTKLAVVFTKADVLMKQPENEMEARVTFDDSSSIYVERQYGQVDIENLKMVSEDVKDYIDRLTNHEFTALVDSSYKDSMFFITSALGQNPQDGKLTSTPRPFRITDPIIWLLYATKSGLLR